MKDVIETKTEIKDGIKYTTHYMNRHIRVGDTQCSSFGYTTPHGLNVTTEIVKYVYLPAENMLD